MSDRFDTLFKDGQLTTRFRLSLAWRVVKVELQWRLLRLREWWQQRSVRNQTWEDLAEAALEVPEPENEQEDFERDYLSHEDIKRFRLMPPQRPL